MHLSSALPEGKFVVQNGQTWYRIDNVHALKPFFMVLAGDSDLWAFVSSAGSLAAGRHNEDGAFFPYETVDKIHTRWEHTGPRTWIHVDVPGGSELWQPFAPRACESGVRRSLWKNLSGTRIRFREEHTSGRLAFQYEWFSSAKLGLVRTSRLESLDPSAPPLTVRVLDGVLNLMPPGIGVKLSQAMSSLTDAYKWNEASAGGRMGLFTLYAQIWDRAEPKECFHALTAWHAGLPSDTRTLLSAEQVVAFCCGETVDSEQLTRGRRGAFLVNFSAVIDRRAFEWHLVLDGPSSQVQAFELEQHLCAGGGTVAEILAERQRNDAGLDELLARADAFQQSADLMASAHHRANVLFNIMRGGVFVDGTLFDRDDLLSFVRHRHTGVGNRLQALASSWPAKVERAFVLRNAREANDNQLERLLLEYLPLTFSRRHGDPSRPWNRFSIRVRDVQGQRVLDHQGNWRDIFQNWEALLPSAPAYAGSVIATFLGSMSPDGYNPYRIGRSGIEWEIIEKDDPWSHIGYWGDHQVIYLLRLMEMAHAHDPMLLPSMWNRALFSFADIPYRLKPHTEQIASPKHTINFDEAAHERATERARRLGSDGLRVCGPDDEPVLATLGEKLAIILLAKAGCLLPGGGLWLHTQRPEWNDANNALVGNGLSIVTLAHLRRFLRFLICIPGADRGFTLAAATLEALEQFDDLVRVTPLSAVGDATARRAFLDGAGTLLDQWRAVAYTGSDGRSTVMAPVGLLPRIAQRLLPMVDATLRGARRDDGLYDSYTLVHFKPGAAEVDRLYPMLEGQVAMLSSGLLSLSESVGLLDAVFASPLYTPDRRSFLLYPDRALPGFLQRNRLDAQALALPVVQRLLTEGRTDLLQRQSDGTVRFAPTLANRSDLEAAARDIGPDASVLADSYERVLHHHEFTGRSGTMFGYEGLGCIYWHMVAKLLLAVQERVFDAKDAGAPELPALCRYYRRVRDGLGYRKSVAEYGAFPADPYSHTPGEGGAQQPGMTGQVKEEILARWGELGVRVSNGKVKLQPVLLEVAEIPTSGGLQFTWGGLTFTYRLALSKALRVRRNGVWEACPSGCFSLDGIDAVEADFMRADLAN